MYGHVKTMIIYCHMHMITECEKCREIVSFLAYLYINGAVAVGAYKGQELCVLPGG